MEFNEWLGFLGEQEINRNVEKAINWIIYDNLVLLNGDTLCEAVVT